MEEYVYLKIRSFFRKKVQYSVVLVWANLLLLSTCVHAHPSKTILKAESDTIGNHTIVPVSSVQIEFRVQKTAKGNILHWRTLSDRNNHYFEVERSTHNNCFQSIGQIDGTHIIQPFNGYCFVDTSGIQEGVHYRVKQRDSSGQYIYSRIVSVQSNNKTFIELPSKPCTDELTIRFYNVSQPEVKVTMWSTKGELVRDLNYTLTDNQLSIAIKDLPSGAYTIHVLNENYRYADRIIKL